MDAQSALDLLIHHGPLALVLLMALNRLSLVPAGMVILVTVGACAAKGALPLPVVVSAAVGGMVLGDAVLYGAGAFGLVWLTRRVEGSPLWARAHAALERWGAPAIFLSRLLLLPLIVPVSLLWGSNRLRYSTYALAAAAGDALYVLVFVGLGYRFGAGWQHALDWSTGAAVRALAGDPARPALFAAGLLAAGLLAYRAHQRRRLTPAPYEVLVEGERV